MLASQVSGKHIENGTSEGKPTAFSGVPTLSPWQLICVQSSCPAISPIMRVENSYGSAPSAETDHSPWFAGVAPKVTFPKVLLASMAGLRIVSSPSAL